MTYPRELKRGRIQSGGNQLCERIHVVMGRLLVSSATDSEDGLPPALIDFHVVAVGDHFIQMQMEDGRRMAVLIRSFDDAAWLQHETSQALAAMISSVRNAPTRPGNSPR